MKILAIDPGETVGFVVLDDWELIEHVELRLPEKDDPDFWAKAVHDLSYWFGVRKPDVIVIEDYRIYAGKADLHIGQRLLTAELIGAICAICRVFAKSTVLIHRLPASKKGRWPDARLDAKFPQHREVTGDHERDALKLALAYKEMQE